MSSFDDFAERLGAAPEGGEGRGAFLEYLRGVTPGERAELPGPRRGSAPEGAAESDTGVLDLPETGG